MRTHGSARPLSSYRHGVQAGATVVPDRAYSNGAGRLRLRHLTAAAHAQHKDQLVAPQSPGRERRVRREHRKQLIIKAPSGPVRLRKDPEVPAAVALHPNQPGFSERLTNAINSSPGPRALSKVVGEYLPQCSAAHLAAAFSRLGGFAAADPPSQADLQGTYWPAATTWAQQLTELVEDASVLDWARALQALSRLQLPFPHLLPLAAAGSTHKLSSNTPQAVAGLVVGLVQHQQLCQQQPPSQQWQQQQQQSWQPPEQQEPGGAGLSPTAGLLQELVMMSYQCMAQFSAQELSHLVYALSVWQYAPSQVWLTRCCRAYRSWWGSPSSFPAALVRFVYSLATLPPCQPLPPGLVLSGALGGVRKQATQEGASSSSDERGIDAGAALSGSTPGPGPAAAAAASPADQAAVMGWDAAPSSGVGVQHAAAPPWDSFASSSQGPAPSSPLPSFNWLCAFLVEARRLIDRLKPGELGTLLWALARLRHSPDLVFMEAWYTAAAAKMDGTRLGVLALQLQALGLLQPGEGVPGAVPERFMLLALGRAEALLLEGKGSAADLGQMLWGLAQLRYWPGQRWMQVWFEGYGARLQQEADAGTLDPRTVADALWALGRYGCQPPAEFFKVLGRALDTCTQQMDARSWAVVFWALLRMGTRPKRDWLVAFKARAAQEYDPAAASQLTQYVAQLLLQASSRASTADGSPAARL